MMADQDSRGFCRDITISQAVYSCKYSVERMSPGWADDQKCTYRRGPAFVMVWAPHAATADAIITLSEPTSDAGDDRVFDCRWTIWGIGNGRRCHRLRALGTARRRQRIEPDIADLWRDHDQHPTGRWRWAFVDAPSPRRSRLLGAVSDRWSALSSFIFDRI